MKIGKIFYSRVEKIFESIELNLCVADDREGHVRAEQAGVCARARCCGEHLVCCGSSRRWTGKAPRSTTRAATSARPPPPSPCPRTPPPRCRRHAPYSAPELRHPGPRQRGPSTPPPPPACTSSSTTSPPPPQPPPPPAGWGAHGEAAHLLEPRGVGGHAAQPLTAASSVPASTRGWSLAATPASAA